MNKFDVVIIGGGPGAYNPEPLAPFFDAFLLGDGDEDLQLTESKSHIDITDNPYLDNSVNRYCPRH